MEPFLFVPPPPGGQSQKDALHLPDLSGGQRDSDRRQVDEYHAAQGAIDQSLGRAAKQSRKRGSADDER